MKQFYSVSVWSVFKKKLKERFAHLTDDDLMAIEAGKETSAGERMTMLERLQRLAGRPAFEIARLADEAAEESRRRPVSARENMLGPIWRGGATVDRARASTA